MHVRVVLGALLFPNSCSTEVPFIRHFDSWIKDVWRLVLTVEG